MADRISYFANAFETTLATSLDSTSMTVDVVDATGLTTPCYVVLDVDVPASREYVRVSSIASNTLTLSERYLAGSAQTSGLSHSSGAKVSGSLAAQSLEDLHDRISALDGSMDEFITFTRVGDLVVESGTIHWPVPYGLTIQDVRARVSSAPTGAGVIVDVLKNGVTIFTNSANRPTISGGSYEGVSGTPDVTALTAGDYLSVDVDQVGSGTPGADLSVVVTFRRT